MIISCLNIMIWSMKCTCWIVHPFNIHVYTVYTYIYIYICIYIYIYRDKPIEAYCLYCLQQRAKFTPQKVSRRMKQNQEIKRNMCSTLFQVVQPAAKWRGTQHVVSSSSWTIKKIASEKTIWSRIWSTTSWKDMARKCKKPFLAVSWAILRGS